MIFNRKCLYAHASFSSLTKFKTCEIIALLLVFIASTLYVYGFKILSPSSFFLLLGLLLLYLFSNYVFNSFRIGHPLLVICQHRQTHHLLLHVVTSDLKFVSCMSISFLCLCIQVFVSLPFFLILVACGSSSESTNICPRFGIIIYHLLNQ
jgi:hypothetical protein